jgi:hypothetical protein
MATPRLAAAHHNEATTQMGSVKGQAGYSGTLLIDKLGIKPGARLRVVNPPAGFWEILGKLPDGVAHVSRGGFDFGMLFVRQRAELDKRFAALRDRLVSTGMLWISWPKKSSRVPSDLSEDIVRAVGLNAGLVDVKVCAVDDIWSGLKFVRRLRDR